MLEGLERRCLLAVSLDLASGQLDIVGGGGNDVVSVSKPSGGGSGYTVVLNGVSQTVTGSVSRIFVDGKEGNDSLIVRDSVLVPVTVNGGAGNDSLYGGGGPSTLNGGAGNDTLNGGPGADVLAGGDGTDTADYSSRSSGLTIGLGKLADDGAAGEHDNVATDVEIVLGGSGNDSIRGSDFNNTLVGNGGNDVLIGLGGDDRLDGGSGNDMLDGGAGADLFIGGSGIDTADYSTRTFNLIIGLGKLADDGSAAEHDNVGTDIELVMGGSGNDVINAGNAFGANNTLLGNGGNDSLIGASGNDSLNGGAGDDSLDGGTGDDTANGEAGNDKLTGGDGNDTAEYGDRSDGFTFDMSGGTGAMGTAVSGGETDVLSDGFEMIGGSDQADSFTTEANYKADIVLLGEGGNDVYNALEKSDGGTTTFFGGEGDDEMFYDVQGDAVFYGERGNDSLRMRDTSTTSFDGGDGIDQVMANPIYDGDIDLNNYPNVENATAYHGTLTGTAGANVLTAAGSGMSINAGEGNDTITGSADDDMINGGAGNDVIDARGGNDLIDGGEGDDMLMGEAGNDTFLAGAGNDEFVGGDGTDTADYSTDDLLAPGFGVKVTADDKADDGLIQGDVPLESDNVHSDIEVVIGTDSSDKITEPVASSVGRMFEGRGGDDSLFGGGGDNTFNGGEGNDFIVGGEGSNQLFGDLGDDTINGGGGNEMIVGGAETIPDVSTTTDADFISAGGGNDTVHGGAGGDTIGGSLGDDLLDGGDGDDSIRGDEGNDSITGDAGNDTLVGGDSDDTIDGGTDTDSLRGDNGNDVLTDDGAADADSAAAVMDGGGDDDSLTIVSYAIGGAGSADAAVGVGNPEIMIGGNGNDTLTGAGGDDLLDGGEGHDLLLGNDGNDTLAGGFSDRDENGDDIPDTMLGGVGNDIFINNDGQTDIIDGGDDLDLAQVESTDKDQIANVEGTYDKREDEEGPVDETALGETGSALVSRASSSALVAAAAAAPNSSITGTKLLVTGQVDAGGTPLNDIIQITLFNGFISVYQNGATVSYPAGSITTIEVDSGSGNDTVALELAGGGHSVTVPAKIIGGKGNDTLRGGKGNDSIFGGDGNDSLIGAGGDDLVQGDGGDDVLNGGSPALFTNDGTDILRGGDGISDAGLGDNVYYSQRTDDLKLTLDGLANDGATGENDLIGSDVEKICGGKGSDLIVGNAKGNFLAAGAGKNTLKGGGGNDTLVAVNPLGDTAIDSLFGNGGRDALFMQDGMRDEYNFNALEDLARADVGLDFSKLADQT